MRVSTRVVKATLKAAQRAVPLNATWRQARRRSTATAAVKDSRLGTEGTTAVTTANSQPARAVETQERTSVTAALAEVAETPLAPEEEPLVPVKPPRKRRVKKVTVAVLEEPEGPPLPPLTPETLPAGVAHITSVDAGLARLVDKYGPPEALVVSTTGSTFYALTRAIVGQQLSVTAAGTIYGRFRTVCGCEPPQEVSPEAVLAAPVEGLRAAGLSGMKVNYLTDLAARYADNRLSCDSLRGMTERQIIENLTAVKGIGRWTADMFAMFTMGRPDCLPVGDLGVQKGFAIHFGLKALPKPEEMERLAEHWRPYRSLGSWYMWRLCEENKPEKKVKAPKGGAAVQPPAPATMVPLP
eukprot:CAMPEP_0206139672 /NCGR_PEP_ID=MMETSP1473-20131121/7004_1 /ASSEMBLY_ACC=CAM_ASM_001109 /TAXON_ID=1461547 /ORGANISM="Stichococcus sp, Strain RCC1054" /LENGTH=354 /DNA_ID=CAMNT_0053533557 /DNA_START=102 /DNA_END=1166 /DNA_ORIENTATION=-